MPTAQQVIEAAKSQVGYRETPNNRTKYGKWYQMDGQPWCAIFVSWVFDQAGALRLNHGKNAYTPTHADRFKKAGQWGTTPKLGAVVFFKFPGGPNRIHHVGIVTGIKDGYIETIEGNTSAGTAGSQRDGGGVWARKRSVGIVGYGYPAYAPELLTDKEVAVLLMRDTENMQVWLTDGLSRRHMVDSVEVGIYTAAGVKVVEPKDVEKIYLIPEAPDAAGKVVGRRK